jgi:hypothetical protein
MFKDVNDRTFVETIDYIILNSDDDVKIKNAVLYLDIHSKQKGMTIYQMIYELFQKNLIEKRSIQRTKTTISNQDKKIFLNCKMIFVIVSFTIFIDLINTER